MTLVCLYTIANDEIKGTYRRFIAGPTVNNSKKTEIFWKLSLNVVENVANVEILLFLFF